VRERRTGTRHTQHQQGQRQSRDGKAAHPAP
jgi:hypothetical protein